MGKLILTLILGTAGAAALHAQATPPAQPAAQQEEEEQQTRRQETFVRRFSGGISIAANLPGPLKEEDLFQSFPTTPPLAITARNSAKSGLASFGATAQLAITERWAVAVTPFIRSNIRFESMIVRLVGNDNPNTVQDDREGTNITSKVSGRFIDVPVLVRYYGKSRFERGPRWFVELGPRMRYTYAVRVNNSIQTPPKGGISEFLSNQNPISYRQRINGASAGFGMQFVDDFGLRFVPEVRYTRWFGKSFGDITGRSRQTQIEIIFTLGF